MEDDIDSLKQRLSQAERKINKIEAEGVKVTGVAAIPEKKKPDAPIPEALEGDVKLVVNNWKRIVEKSDPVIRQFLAESTPSTDGSRLVIKCKDDIVLGTMKGSGSIDLLNEVFENEIHKKVDYVFYAPSKDEGANEKYPDLSKFILDEIEIVDDNDDEEDD